MRKLNLKKDTLVELTSAELDGIAGAAAITKDSCLYCTSEVDACITAWRCTDSLLGC
ncbi:MAG: hypothetical protein QOE45_1183 [Frankiaceae bacterium]|jgi:hypothetical protein|nr:hypothetical protein [Frankiaceae bacterium]